MNSKIEINKNQHAYLITGEKENTLPILKETLERIFEIKLAGNPDYRESYFESLGIDEARELKEEQSRRAFGGTNKFFVIIAGSITREAQNAMLKVFEEPTEGTYIFLIIPNVRQIIPTLLSRVRVIQFLTSNFQSLNNDAKKFLETPVEKRLQLPFIKQMIEDKEKQPVISFFNALEESVYELFPPQKISAAERGFFDELIKYRGYAGDRSSSVKMLLEHIALVTPRM